MRHAGVSAPRMPPHIDERVASTAYFSTGTADSPSRMYVHRRRSSADDRAEHQADLLRVIAHPMNSPTALTSPRRAHIVNACAACAR